MEQDPKYPDGWMLQSVKRRAGKSAGTMDKYWYSPLKKKKFRSHVEVQRYLGMLEIAKGDEDLAFKYFKQPRLAQPLIENMEQDEEKTKAPEGGKTSKFSIRSINVSTKLNTTKSVTSKISKAFKASKASTVRSAIVAAELPSPDIKSPRSSGGKINYLTMATACIRHLKDHNGSSFPAIYKALQALYNKPDTPQNRATLYKTLKQGVSAGRFERVRNSFKMNAEWSRKEREEKRKKEREKKRLMDKRKKELQQAKDKKLKAKEEEDQKEKERKENERKEKEREERMKNQTDEERQEELEKERIKAEKLRIQKEKEREAKILAEKIRKRKFPMDDLELIKEDRLLHVKPPHPKTSPPLPLVIADTPQLNYSQFRRGAISDIFQIFHFFRGDVGWRTEETAEFKLDHLFHCCQEISNGNAKNNGTLPPLVVHLFMVALQRLLNESAQYPELERLGDILTPQSWSEILRHYIDFMQEHSISDSMPYVLRDFTKEDPDELPAHYYGYLGSPKDTLAKAHAKLSKTESFHLTVDESMCLLRVLCDDILADSPELMEDIDKRMEEMNELTKAKKAAESYWRKIRLAYEGPKYPSRKKKEESKATTEGGTDDKKDDNSDEEKKEDKNDATENSADAQNDEEEEGTTKKDVNTSASSKAKVSKPSKKEYENAEKAKQRAVDNYDRALRKLVARTEPLGYNRDYCAVYHFYHDPENVYIETLPLSKKDAGGNKNENRTWRMISCKSLFDDYIATLDERGIRENELKSNLTYKGYARKFLYDDIRVQHMINTMKREEENLQKKFESAKEACAESNRRSGRLVGIQQLELQKIEDEINDFETMKSGKGFTEPKTTDLKILTGFEILKQFERKSTDARLRCGSLWGQSSNSGFIKPMIWELLELEKQCNSLVPWERDDVSRDDWLDTLKNIRSEWEKLHPFQLGEKDDDESSDGESAVKSSKQDDKLVDNGSSRSSKRRRTDSDKKVNPSQNRLGLLKKALLDLETRVMKLSGKLVKYTDEKYFGAEIENSTSDEDQLQLQQTWKKQIYSLNSIPTSKTALIRDILISAIASARAAHLKDVTHELRSSLKLFRPNAAGASKVAALAVLEQHGGYEIIDEDEATLEKSMTDASLDEHSNSLNMLSDEAIFLSCHLEEEDEVDRDEWIESVKACKTLSRFSAFVDAFNVKAKAILKDIESSRAALNGAIKYWKDQNGPKRGKKKKPKSSKYTSETNFWVHSVPTERYVLTKLGNRYPWWPARICQVKDESLEKELEKLDRVVISFVGGEQLFVVVKGTQIKPYSREVMKGDTSKFDEDLVSSWKESIAMIARIIPEGSSTKECTGSEEEKKS